MASLKLQANQGNLLEIERAVFHSLTTLSAMMYFYFTHLIGAYVLLLVGILFVALDVGRARSARVRGLLPGFVLKLVREEEENRISTTTHFVIAAVLVDFLFLFLGLPKDAVLPAVVFSSVGDPVARLAGRAWGIHLVPGTEKTFIGSAAFFCTGLWGAILVCLAVGADWTWDGILGGALFATLLELYSGRWDNLTIPFLTSLCIWGIMVL